jgi:hypothetical protein
MNFILDHWSSILSNVVAILGAFYGLVMALQAAFAFVGMFWAPAKRVVAFLAVVGTDVKQLKDKLPGGGAGGSGVASILFLFATSRILAVLVFVGCSAMACGLIRAVPDLTKAVLCEESVVSANPGLTFAQLVSQSLKTCGQDGAATIADVIDAILASSDPAMAAYKSEAQATRGDPAKMGALRAHLGGHR